MNNTIKFNMHELSIVMSIIEIAQQQATLAEATVIEEIEMDIGNLSAIDMNAFDFAWRQAIKETILENAERKINCIEGKAKCLHCGNVFPVSNVYDACPLCGKFKNEILQGKELRVKSVIVS